MTLTRFGAVLLALMLVPVLALAAGMEGTVVKIDKQKNVLVIKTEEGEKSLEITGNTKGLENAIEGAQIKVEYSKQGNKLRASEINPSKSGTRG